MPARQRGSTVRRGKSWAARYRDDEGVQRLVRKLALQRAASTQARAQLRARHCELRQSKQADCAVGGAERALHQADEVALMDEIVAEVGEPLSHGGSPGA